MLRLAHDELAARSTQLLVPVVVAARLVQQQLGGAAAELVRGACAPTTAARRPPRRSRCRRSRRSRSPRAPGRRAATISCSTPRASRSLAQIAAVGRRAAGRSDDLLAGLAPAGDGQRRAATARSARRRTRTPPGPRARRRRAARAPAAGPSGPPTNAIRRCPRSSRCSAASRPPRTSSTATEHWSAPAARRSTSTTGTPALAQRLERGGRARAVGVMSTPWTRCSASRSRCAASLAGRSSVLQRITARPSALAAPRPRGPRR